MLVGLQPLQLPCTFFSVFHGPGTFPFLQDGFTSNVTREKKNELTTVFYISPSHLHHHPISPPPALLLLDYLFKQTMDDFDALVQRFPTKTACHHCSFKILDVLAVAVGKEIACALRRVTLPAESTAPHIAIMMSPGLGLVAAIVGTLKVGAIPLIITDEYDPRTSSLDEHCQILLADTMHIESLLAREINVPPTLVFNTAALTVQGVSGIVLKKAIHLPSFDGYDKVSLLQKRRAMVTHETLVQHQNCMYLRCDTEGQLEGMEEGINGVVRLWRIHDVTEDWNEESEEKQPTTESQTETNSSVHLHPSTSPHSHPSSYPSHHTISSSVAVQHHICQLIQRIKGTRPPPTASFAAIGSLSLLTH